MPSPETVRVKLSSEAAGGVALTPVVVQEMVLTDLAATILSAAGEEARRLHEILKRGSVVSGATRFRWEPLQLSLEEATALFEASPRSDPTRLFVPDRCVRAVLHSGRSRFEVTREAGARRRLLRRRCFWDAVLGAAGGEVSYVRYLHRDQTDHYTASVTPEAAAALRAAAPLLAFPHLARQLAASTIERVDWFTRRG